MALTHHNTVIISRPLGYRLRRRHNGNRCTDSRDDIADSSCYAHSVEYDISSNKVWPLRLYTDTWFSSGFFLSNGTLLQTGGYGSGTRRIRYYRTCGDRKCDWWQSEHDRVTVVGWWNKDI
ncbi:hypothetical protein DVH24_008657 [Malus domestica]|uniref:Glyoxal oxidase N-terminal domain-containing protein n=1 Tax=Malus domestica TaxID=3750 RepID=A0A498JMQ8_MALDO|nr:hypothetical protein DVH24_008657 [Malus domestica]